YTLAERTRVCRRVYNVAGHVVATLVKDIKKAGPHTVEWNGTSDSGASVSSGVYFYRIVAGDRTMTKKMVLLR
ncbi:MAG: FlgD immunoglobulin-like domain containing protein, partial [bacterium]